MPNYLTFSYWFTLQQEAFLPNTAKFVIGLLVLSFLVGAVLKIFRAKEKDKYRKKILSKISNLCVTNAIIGFLLLFFTLEEIPFLGMRLWYLILLIFDGVFAVFAIKEYYKKAPQERQKTEERREFEKYLPRKRGA